MHVPRLAESAPRHRRSIDDLDWIETRGAYGLRYARSAEDRKAVQSLRFEVFSREMGAVVQGAEQKLDLDRLDECTDHLMVIDRDSGTCVGSYRLATLEQVSRDSGFYTQRIFDLDRLEPEVLKGAVELSRACVALPHRTRGVFQLLLRGIGSHLIRTRKRFLFGCGSIPIKERGQAAIAIEAVKREGWLDGSIDVRPMPDYRLSQPVVPCGADPEIPALLYAYCAIGARLGAIPAHDEDFGTLDFFVLLDLKRVDQRTYARYCQSR